MTYEEVWINMSKRERVACAVMSLMRVNETGFWSTCILNKWLSKFASLILGKNVFDWELDIASKLEDWQDVTRKDERDELINEMLLLKELLA